MRIHGHGTGVTVLELMVTLSIAATLAVLAVPSYETFTAHQHMKAAVAGLHNDLVSARSQAIHRGSHIVACPGSPETGCSGDSRWDDGWIVFEDTDADRQRGDTETLLRHGQPPSTVDIRTPASRSALRFSPDGSAPGSNVSIGLCGRDGPASARKLVLSNIGRIRRAPYPDIDPSQCPG